MANHNYKSILIISGLDPMLSNTVMKEKIFDAQSLFIDLETLVPESKKTEARLKTDSFLENIGKIDFNILVRTNSADSVNFEKDLAILNDHAEKLSAGILPKAENPLHIDEAIGKNSNLNWLLTIESKKGLDNLEKLLSVNDYIEGCIFGNSDYSKDVNKDPKESFLFEKKFISRISKELNKVAIDGPSKQEITDLSFEIEMKMSAKYFDGRCATNAKHINHINNYFSNTQISHTK